MGDSTAAAYALFGLVLAVGGGCFALTRERADRSYYASDVYHLTPKSHRRFFYASLACALLFALALRVSVITVPLLGLYVFGLIFYVSSFARGFSDSDD